MKTQIISPKFLTVLGFTLLVSFVSPIVPALGTSEFEVGTQFGISHLIPTGDDSTTTITHTRLPSGTFLDIGSSPTSLYATWFPNKLFAIGPEFSIGRTSVSDEYLGEEKTESITTLYLGGRAVFFPLSHFRSTPYVLGRISQTIFYEEERILTSFGIGLGYQWRIGTAFVFRGEGQYQRLLVSDEDDDANEFSLIFGIGTRFGNSK